MKPDPATDSRIVMTLDAGGTSFRFSAVRGNRPACQVFSAPSRGDDLAACLATLVDGFARVREALPEPPVAISFAFPGPCDYGCGIVGDLQNLPCFRGGVALGPMLEDRFGVPTFLNNDGDLFVYGEAMAGLLPHVNGLLERSGSAKRYKNLIGVTLGTGFGGGITRDGVMFRGDNLSAGEVWLLRNKRNPAMAAEEGACERAVRREYAAASGSEDGPGAKEVFAIAGGDVPGDRNAALQSFRCLGEVVGDALAQTLTLTDGLAVVGGGVSGAWTFFAPALMEELNGSYERPDGSEHRRLVQRAFNLEDPSDRERFLRGETREITIPGSLEIVHYDPMPRVAVGRSRLGTSEAVSIGAYAYALERLSSAS